MSSTETAAAIGFVITGDVMLYVTLPLHARLLYVLLRSTSKRDLDGSFHTLMINTTIVNLIFALDCCLILEPSASGVFFEFYNTMGPYFAKIELIKTSVLPLIADILRLTLAINRFTAISYPLQHRNWWHGRSLFWFCAGLWIVGFCACIPLLLPGSTEHTVGMNLYGVQSVEYGFLGDYYAIYSLGGSFGGAAFEIISLLFYIGMLFKFRQFSKFTKSGATEVRRMTRGVMRTTITAACISMSAWLLVILMMTIFISFWTTGQPYLVGNYFSAAFRFLNAFNNIITPWVLLIAFQNVRRLVFNNNLCRPAQIVPTGTGSDGLTKI